MPEITRTSQLTGQVHTLDLDVTEAEITAVLQGDVLIQNALPHLSAADREFILTGITAGEWEALFGDDDEEEEE